MSETSLPSDMPPSWLKQIKDAVKPGVTATVLSTLLGSSVIAALVSFVTEYRLESHKASVELAKAHALETRQSLQSLSGHLVTLDLQLDNLVTTIDLVPRNAKSKSKLSLYAKKSIEHVGTQMALVFADSKSPRINSDIGAHVVAVLDALAPQLVRVQSDFKNIYGLAELYRTDLKTRMLGVQSEIDKAVRLTEE